MSWREVRFYLRLIRRWFWLFLLLMLISALVSLHLVRAQPRVYAASAVVRVSSALAAPNPNPTSIQVGTSLTLYYSDLAQRTPLVRRALERHKIPLDAATVIDKMLFVYPLSQAQLIELEIVDTDPGRAAAIANALADELVRQSPADVEAVEKERLFAQQRLDELRQRIDERRRTIDQLQQRIGTLTSRAEIADVERQITLYNADLNTLEEIRQGYSWIITGSSVNRLSLFQPAQAPAQPLPVKTRFTVMLGAMLGLALAILGIILLERLDKHWSPGEDLDLLLGLGQLAVLPHATSPLGSEASLSSARGQAVRELRTALLLRMVDRPLKTLMVCNVQSNYARTAVATDLGAVFALSGQDVVLVDVRLTEPHLSRQFLPVIAGGWRSALQDPAIRIDDLLVQTRIAGLRLLPGAGGEPGSAPELLPSLEWARLVVELGAAGDLILFDGPPCLQSADAALLAPLVDGVVMVVDPLVDSRADIKRALGRVGSDPRAHLLGLVVVSDRQRGLLRRRASRSTEEQPSSAVAQDLRAWNGDMHSGTSTYAITPGGGEAVEQDRAV